MSLFKRIIFSFCVTICISLGLAPLIGQAARRNFNVVQAWIPMKDGVRLAASLFMPENENANLQIRLPVLLEYLPYRKDDIFAYRDYELHSYFAKRGYITARVDIRGTGNSEGVLPDHEYSEQEQLDGLEVIDWLSRQS